jgi:hypothetical protein
MAVLNGVVVCEYLHAGVKTIVSTHLLFNGDLG